MRKTFVGVSVVMGLLLATAVPVFAKTSVSPSPIKKEMKTWRSEKRIASIKNYWGNMAKRLGVIVRNEERIAEKIGKKIEQRATAGKDVSAARVKLEEGKKLIAEAKAMLASGVAKVDSVITSAKDEKAASQQVKQFNKDILEKIRSAHAILVDVLKLVRDVKSTPSLSPSAH
jgi:hypothetical protein